MQKLQILIVIFATTLTGSLLLSGCQDRPRNPYATQILWSTLPNNPSTILTGPREKSAKPVAATQDELRRTVAELSANALDVPPRSVSDIISNLDRVKRVDTETLGKRLAIADQWWLAGSSSRFRLINFYLGRGLAAADLGRHKQAITDFGTAVRIARLFGSPQLTAAALDLYGISEIRYGHHARGMGAYREAAEMSRALRVRFVLHFDWWIHRMSLLAAERARSGDIETAENYLERISDTVARLRDAPGVEMQIAH